MRTLLLVLILPIFAAGQSVKLPERVQAQPGRIARIAIDWDGDDFKFDVDPRIDVFREYDPDPKKVRLCVLAAQPGEYRLLGVAAKGGRLSEFASTTIVVGPPVPPTPPTPPTPPEPTPDPVDPAEAALATRIRASARSDGWNAAQLQTLAGAMRRCASVAATVKSGRDATTKYAAEMQRISNSVPKMVELADLLAGEMQRLVPVANADAEFSGDQRNRLRDSLLLIARALDRASR